ncbi:serine (or cysteine) peptidase inhibitor clade A (alpha-1 antiproteinase antitrypsin) member 7 [Cricetulus griseus]
MSVFLYLFLLVFGLQDTINCAQYNSSEGKVTTCHLPQQNTTLYKMPFINADFAFSLYRRFSVENPDWNIFFSPVSISAALAMLSFGSGSSTQTQILEVLGFNLTDTPVTELHQGFQHLICLLNFPKNELELQMGNAVFIGQHLKPLAKFLDDVKTLYETEVFPTDFSNVSAAQQEINSYAFHKAVLHIGEGGTKEGAAPEVVSLDLPEVAPLHPIIRIDRPFLLMILEKRTRSILFLGKVVNPSKE